MFTPITHDQFHALSRVVDDLLRQVQKLDDELVLPKWDGSVSNPESWADYRAETYQHFGRRDAYAATTFALLSYMSAAAAEWQENRRAYGITR